MTYYFAAELEQADKLLKYEDVMDSLSPYDGLGRQIIGTDGTTEVHFEVEDLPEDYKDLAETDVIEGTTLSVDGTEMEMTRGAFDRVLQQAGLRPAYAQKTPGNLLAPHLNYHYTHGGTKAEQLTVLSAQGKVLELIPGNATPFSNYQVVEAVADAASRKFGVDPDQFFFDFKIENTLERFAGRLIVPDTHKVSSMRHSAAVEDLYSTGIYIQNSMVADVPKTPTTITGYLFAWWCKNGSTTTMAHSAEYSKREVGVNWEDVNSWIQDSTLASLNGLPEEIKRVQALTEIDLSGEIGTTTRDLMRSFGVPITLIQPITDQLIESDDMSAYGLMQAITQAANAPDLSDAKRTKLMEAGGGVAHVLVERCDTCHRIPV